MWDRWRLRPTQEKKRVRLPLEKALARAEAKGEEGGQLEHTHCFPTLKKINSGLSRLTFYNKNDQDPPLFVIYFRNFKS